jgi:hypothetical protein
MPSNPLGLGIEMACHVRRRLLRGDQKRMSTEADTCREYVVPKLQAAGWDNDPHSIAEQRWFTKGASTPGHGGICIANPWTNGVCYRVLADIYERRGASRNAINALESLMETDRQLGKRKFKQDIRDRIATLRSHKTKESTAAYSKPELLTDVPNQPTNQEASPTVPAMPPRPHAPRLEDRIQSAINKVAHEAWEAAAGAPTTEEALKIAKQEAMRLIAGLSREIRGHVNHYFTSAKWAPLKERAPKKADTAAREEDSSEDTQGQN